MIRIVMVCSGNICRSPMAAVIAQKLLGERAMVISAGTLGIHGEPAALHAQRAVEARGLSLAAHASQGVSLPLMRAADHLVVMSPIHEAELLRRDRNIGPKIVRLWAYATPAGRLREIVDPVGMDLTAFERCRDDLEQCLAAWVATLS